MTIDSRKLIAQVNVSFDKELLEGLKRAIVEKQREVPNYNEEEQKYLLDTDPDPEGLPWVFGYYHGVRSACKSIIVEIDHMIRAITKEEGPKRPDWEL